jgi:integrase
MSVRVAWKNGRKRWLADCRAFGLGQLCFDTKKDAEDHHDQMKRRYGGGRAAVAPSTTFGEYAPRWEASMRDGLKPRSRNAYRAILRTHLVPVFGEVRMRELTSALVLDWARAQRATLAAATVKLHLHVLRLVCRRAVVEGVLIANPVAEVVRELGLLTEEKAPGAAYGDRVKALTVEQLNRFLAIAATHAPVFHPLWRVQVMTGLRPGEVAGLHVSDVLDETGAVAEDVHVRRTVASNGKETGSPKTPTACRSVELSPNLRAFLTEYLTAKRLRFTPDAILFPAPRRPGYLASSVVASAFKSVLRKAGLPAHLTPHGLRHSFASMHLAHGADVYWLARQLGHKDIRMTTAIYGHWIKPRRPETLAKFDAVLAVANSQEAAA